MILLDTNVISEMMKIDPEPNVRLWLDQQIAETVYISSISLAELLFGIAAMPTGVRKQRLAMVLERVVDVFDGRLVSFDAACARTYAILAARARSAGLGSPIPDGYIAAIAATRGFAVATRDVGPFAAAGLEVINPWSAR